MTDLTRLSTPRLQALLSDAICIAGKKRPGKKWADEKRVKDIRTVLLKRDIKNMRRAA